MTNGDESISNYFQEYSLEEMKLRAENFRIEMQGRRSVRDFSSRAVPKEIIEDCLLVAGSAPSGANMQPWHFVVVNDSEMKKKIRTEAEKNENEFYDHKATDKWLDAITPFKTNAVKPFLEIAPYLIVIFAERNRVLADGTKEQNYYVSESAGIATGFLIAAIHKAGLVCLPYSPSPMGFLNKLLDKPENEKAFLVIAVGYPADDATVPAIRKKNLDELATFI